MEAGRLKVGLLLFGWATATIGGFWYYDGRYRLPVPARKAENLTLGQRLFQPGSAVTLLAFYDPGCPCSRFAQAHVDELRKTLASRGLAVKMILVAGGNAPAGYDTIRDSDEKIAHAFGIPAAPAAVVLDHNGSVMYTGGYNAARYCDDDQTAFARQAIVAVLDGRKPNLPHGNFYGCRVADLTR